MTVRSRPLPKPSSVARIATAVLAASLDLPRPTTAAPAIPEMHTALIYDGRLYLKVLEMRTDSHVTARSYVSAARADSTGVLAVFKKLDFDTRAEGRVAGGWPIPVRFFQETFDGRKRRRFAVNWSSRPGEAQAHRFAFADPLTQFLRLMLTPMAARPCPGPVPIFDGRQRYMLEPSFAGPGQLSPAQRQQGLADPVRCHVAFRPLAGFSRAPGSRQPALRSQVTATFARASAAGIWVLTDMEADTLIGPAHLALTHVDIQGGIGALASPRPAAAPPLPPVARRPKRRS